jgi:endonuclease/exonuclease/phosphatase family metal-dependent hydrolase
MGDLNHKPEQPEYMQWINSGFIDTFIEAGSGSGLTIRADNPTRRIDYILIHGIKAENIFNSQALFKGAFRTNAKDSSSYALSDHIPYYAEIRT